MGDSMVGNAFTRIIFQNQCIFALVAVLLCAGMFTTTAHALNPILPAWEYVPDGEPYVFEDPDIPGAYRLYIYGSHDTRITNYCGTDQVVWSAPIDDLTDWRYDGVSFSYSSDVLFAPDIAVVYDENDVPTYYLYPNDQKGKRNSLVAISHRPDGPFEPINLDGSSSVGVMGFDPAVFVDDDGRVYGYWGFTSSYAAELDPETMSTVLEGTEIINPFMGDDVFYEASSIRKLYNEDGSDSIYVFIWSSVTDGSCLDYAYSDSPLGSFSYGGTIVDNNGISGGNNHGSIVEVGDQWYIVYHRQTTNEYARQTMAEPIEITVDWNNRTVSIPQVENTSQGFEMDGLNPFVQYSAGIACEISDMRIASNYNHVDSYNNLYNVIDGSYAGYKYFNFGEGYDNTEIAVTMTPQGNDGTMSVRTDSSSGTVIATIAIDADMAQTLTTFTVPITETLSGKESIYFTFTSSSGEVAEVSYFEFIQNDIDINGFAVETTDYEMNDVTEITATTSSENTTVTITQATADNGNYAVVTFQTGDAQNTYTIQMGDADDTKKAAAIAENLEVANAKAAIGNILISGAAISPINDVQGSAANGVLTLTKGNTTQATAVETYVEKSLSDLTTLIETATALADADYTNESYAEVYYALKTSNEMTSDSSTEYISLCYSALDSAVESLAVPVQVRADIAAIVMTSESYDLVVTDAANLTNVEVTAVVTGVTDAEVTGGSVTKTAGDDFVTLKIVADCTEDGTIATIKVDGITSLVITDVVVTGTDAEGTTEIGYGVYTTDAVSFIPNADLNGDGTVDLLDMTEASQYFGVTIESATWIDVQYADLNGDGIINVNDIVEMCAMKETHQ